MKNAFKKHHWLLLRGKSIEAIENELCDFSKGEIPFDDITMVIVKKDGWFLKMIGNTLNDRYRLDRELGRGGMGSVFQGYDLLLNRTVAVKMVMSANLDQQDKENLLNEARSVAQLNHPNIVSVYDAGPIRGYTFHCDGIH